MSDSTRIITFIRFDIRSPKIKTGILGQHETELLLHGGAENMLKQLGISPKNIDLSRLQNEYNQLLSQKETLQKTINLSKKK